MNTKSAGWCGAMTFLVALGMVGTIVVRAAEEPAAAPAGEKANRPREVRRAGAGFGGEWLDQQQRDLLRESLREHSEALRKIDERVRKAQRELMQAVLAEKFDENLVREKAEAVGKLQTEQTVLRAKVVCVVVPTLKPEQRELIENSPFALQMLIGLAAGGGGTADPPGRPERRGGERLMR